MGLLLPRDVLFAAGGDVLQKYGTLVKRNWPADRHGEDLRETYTRAGASGGIGYISPGVLGFVPVAANTPVVEWGLDPLTDLVQPYWLFQPAATNKLTAPEDLTNAAWTKTGTTIPTTTNTSPRGDATAGFLREDTSNGSHLLNQNFTLGAAADTSGDVVFLKANGRTKARFRMLGSGGSKEFTMTVDLSAGTVTTSAGSNGATLTFAKLRQLGNGWFALELYGATNDVGTTVVFTVILQNATGQESYTGDGASGMFVWGGVGTDNQIAGDYWGTTATRNAETVTVPWYVGQGPFSIYARFIERGGRLPNNASGPAFFGSVLPFSRFDTFANPGYRWSHQEVAGAVAVGLHTSATDFQVQELLGITFADESVQLSESGNGAAELTGAQSAALAFTPNYGGQLQLLIGQTGWLGALSRLMVFSGPNLPLTIAAARGIL